MDWLFRVRRHCTIDESEIGQTQNAIEADAPMLFGTRSNDQATTE